MKSILSHLIYLKHETFIRGRSITNNVMVVQEFLHDMWQAQGHCCLVVIKLDMQWAYDRVRWSFLEHALHNFDFHARWIDWIVACIHRPPFAILLNSMPSYFFFSTVEIHQGYPLSPYFFICHVDIFFHALHVAARSFILDHDPYKLASGAMLIFYCYLQIFIYLWAGYLFEIQESSPGLFICTIRLQDSE